MIARKHVDAPRPVSGPTLANAGPPEQAQSAEDLVKAPAGRAAVTSAISHWAKGLEPTAQVRAPSASGSKWTARDGSFEIYFEVRGNVLRVTNNDDRVVRNYTLRHDSIAAVIAGLEAAFAAQDG